MMGPRPGNWLAAAAAGEVGLIMNAAYDPAGIETVVVCGAITAPGPPTGKFVFEPLIGDRPAVPKNQKVTVPDCGAATKPNAMPGSSEVFAIKISLVYVESATTNGNSRSHAQRLKENKLICGFGKKFLKKRAIGPVVEVSGWPSNSGEPAGVPAVLA